MMWNVQYLFIVRMNRLIHKNVLPLTGSTMTSASQHVSVISHGLFYSPSVQHVSLDMYFSELRFVFGNDRVHPYHSVALRQSINEMNHNKPLCIFFFYILLIFYYTSNLASNNHIWFVLVVLCHAYRPWYGNLLRPFLYQQKIAKPTLALGHEQVITFKQKSRK